MASGKYSLPRVMQILNTRTLNATNTCKHIHTYLHTCTFLHHTFMEKSLAMDRRNTHILSTSKSKQNWTRKYSSKSGLQSLHIWVLINKLSSQVSIVFSVNFFILLLSDNSFRTWCSNCEHLWRKVCSMHCKLGKKKRYLGICKTFVILFITIDVNVIFCITNIISIVVFRDG